MDARSFISQKHDAAIDELKALETEYLLRRDAAQAAIELAQRWLSELEAGKAEPQVSTQQFAKPATGDWVSAPDLASQLRTGGV